MRGGRRAVSLHLQDLVKLLYRLACGVLGYSQIEIFQKAFKVSLVKLGEFSCFLGEKLVTLNIFLNA